MSREWIWWSISDKVLKAALKKREASTRCFCGAAAPYQPTTASIHDEVRYPLFTKRLISTLIRRIY
jgi:hypothetical protein